MTAALQDETYLICRAQAWGLTTARGADIPVYAVVGRARSIPDGADQIADLMGQGPGRTADRYFLAFDPQAHPNKGETR